MTERWLPIEGTEHYEVSDLGRVRSLPRVVEQMSPWGSIMRRKLQGRLLKPQAFSNGYLFVRLGDDPKAHLVQRLVATAFVAGDASLTVNHRDGNRAHNRAINLEWVTQSANIQHAHDHLPRKQHALTTPVVVGGNEYPSMLAAARALHVAVGSVASALRKGHLVCNLEVRLVLPCGS